MLRRWGLRGRYLRALHDVLHAEPGADPPLLTAGDLSGLPEAVRGWLDRVGAVGRPRVRWSTPIERYTTIDGCRLPERAEARWGEPGHAWSYAELVLETIRYDVEGERARRRR